MPIGSITLPDGRELETFVEGPEGALPLVFHHGTPGAATPSRLLLREVLGRGLRFVSFARPGYGDSVRLLERTVVDVVPDTAALLESIGVSSCLVAGWSGGGPHALACAARLPGVRAALSIASIGPHGALDLDFFAGMGVENIEEFGYARTSENSLRDHLGLQRQSLLDTDAQGVIESMSGLLPEVDRAALTDEYGEDVAASFGEALRRGIDGWVDDDQAFVGSWGFDLDEIAVPVHVWQGGLDQMVPAGHGAWLAAKIPTAVPHLLRSEGHLSIGVGAMSRMLDALIASK